MPDNADTSTTLTKFILGLSNVWGDRWQVVIAGNMVIRAIAQLVGASVNPIAVVNIFGGNPHSYWEKLNVVFKLRCNVKDKVKLNFPSKQFLFYHIIQKHKIN